MKRFRLLLLALLVSLPVFAATVTPPPATDPYQPVPYVQVKHPEWSKHATIYQVNVRQFSPEGTFAAVEKELPRIQALNVDIIWLMPIHPIGEKNRKGSLGSPYSVKDYYGVNPEFGTLDDLKRFVATAHGLGLKVILDWVPNHTAWDNPLTAEHPDWYQKDWKGSFRPTPWFDWSDIINLDYRSPGLRRYMTEVMKYWVRDVGIDGYRCDVAGFIPLDFWNNLRRELDAIKPVFMLAEWESRDLHAQAFDMTYAWQWYDEMHKLCTGKTNVGALFNYYAWNEGFYPEDIMRMTFVSNHDKNAWEGTEFENFRDGLDAAIVLSVVSEGMPLIYNGQEAGSNKRLAFFEKDPIQWREHRYADFYRQLFALKKANTALWNARWGARMVQVVNTEPTKVFSFVRQNAADKVFALMNFSNETLTIKLTDGPYAGRYTEFFTGEKADIAEGAELTLATWTYRVYVK
ncbi:MAG: alpha-amylase family glycosyl hydrolase [Lacunisphaera sp.]|nr:alpha-amylase family glycosyl hydrolase [Lacunisphaera sp.]